MRKAVLPVLALTLVVVIVGALLSWVFAPGPAEPGAADGGQSAAGPSSTGPAEAQLPALTGRTAADAIGTLKELGFQVAGFTDVTGKGRDYDASAAANPPWVVCFQSPMPGTRSTAGVVTMSIAPRPEGCPARDRGWPWAGGTGLVEDLRGQTVQHATDIASGQATVTVTDARSGGAVKDPQPAWLVCAATVDADGTGPNTVVLQAVPKGVSCPA